MRPLASTPPPSSPPRTERFQILESLIPNTPAPPNHQTITYKQSTKYHYKSSHNHLISHVHDPKPHLSFILNPTTHHILLLLLNSSLISASQITICHTHIQTTETPQTAAQVITGQLWMLASLRRLTSRGLYLVWASAPSPWSCTGPEMACVLHL